ncbi:MAG: site-specific integrase, partial [Vitreoscilla sp.]|nr:site-specific integrase [Vitreoscilla sp.]
VATVRPGPAELDVPKPPEALNQPAIVVQRGAKNGKVRVVATWEDWQQQVLVVLQDWLREEGRPNGAIGGADRDLKGNLARYSRVLTKAGLTKKLIGATGHGLRAGFACRMLESFGVQAPVRGADLRQADRESTDQAAAATSVALGHGRLAATSYYIGARNRVLPDAQPRSAQTADIEALRKLMHQTRRERAAIRAYDRAIKLAKAELAASLVPATHFQPTLAHQEMP